MPENELRRRIEQFLRKLRLVRTPDTGAWDEVTRYGAPIPVAREQDEVTRYGAPMPRKDR